MILADTHVHFHSCFQLEAFLDAAARNLHGAAASLGSANDCKSMLWLAETQRARWFQELQDLAGGNGRPFPSCRWRFELTGEENAIRCRNAERGDLLIVAGRQIVTAERLEILALGTTALLDDGMQAHDTMTAVLDLDALPVLPWGFGKWLGKRGKLLHRLLDEVGSGTLFLGDNSGRLGLWPAPREFRVADGRGMKILPGSDPLPFPKEHARAGSYGFCLDRDVSERSPVSETKALLRDATLRVASYGKLETPARFLRNQIAMQWAKRNVTQQ